MFRSIVNLTKQLNEMLLQFPAIVNRFEAKDFSAVSSLIKWSKECEDIMLANNINSVSQLAGLRGRIIAARETKVPKVPKYKMEFNTAAEVLYDVQNIVFCAVGVFDEKITQAKDLIKQLLTIVAQSKAIKYKKKDDFQQFLEKVWQAIVHHEQLGAGAVKLKSLMNRVDIILLMAEEIDLEDWK